MTKQRLLAITMILFLLSLCGGLSPGLGSQDETFNPDKIDPIVIDAFDDSIPLSVVILGERQMLATPDGFSQFISENADRQRLSLQSEVIATLKEIASAEQPKILEALDVTEDFQSLWLINALVLELTEAQVRAASLLDEVKYIYATSAMGPGRDNPGVVQALIEPGSDRAFSTANKTIPWNLERVGASRVWEEFGVIGEGVIIAMLDNGVHYQHSDLLNNIWMNSGEIPNNGVDDEGNGFIDDIYGYDFGNMKAEVGNFDPQNHHGTWVGGILAGDGTGGTITGVAPRARLMPLLMNSLYSVVLAHEYAIENGADVMNMSFSLPNLGDARGLWRLMAEHAIAAGLVLVSGAGNFQQNQPIPVQLRTPEDIPSVIAVGGVDQQLNVTFYSSLGPVEWASVKFYEDFPQHVKPDLVAFPGPNYPLLHPSGSGYIDPNPNLQGNSFSGPHAAGAAALLLSADPEIPAWEIKAVLESTAMDLGDPGKDNQTGLGLINVYEAVRAVMNR